MQSVLIANNVPDNEAVGNLQTITANDEEPPNTCPDSERNGGSVWQKLFGGQVASSPGFKIENCKIWSQVILIHEKISSFEEPREADFNNSQLVNIFTKKPECLQWNLQWWETFVNYNI